MRNVVCALFVVLLNRRAIALVVLNSKIVLFFDWRYWITYFIKKLLPLLGILGRTCRPCGFAIMKLENDFLLINELHIRHMCVKDVVYVLIFDSFSLSTL
jgi:hypothetical protein